MAYADNGDGPLQAREHTAVTVFKQVTMAGAHALNLRATAHSVFGRWSVMGPPDRQYFTYIERSWGFKLFLTAEG